MRFRRPEMRSVTRPIVCCSDTGPTSVLRLSRRGGAVITQNKIPPVRHLVRQRDGAVAQRAVGDVRLIKQIRR